MSSLAWTARTLPPGKSRAARERVRCARALCLRARPAGPGGLSVFRYSFLLGVNSKGDTASKLQPPAHLRAALRRGTGGLRVALVAMPVTAAEGTRTVVARALRGQVGTGTRWAGYAAAAVAGREALAAVAGRGALAAAAGRGALAAAAGRGALAAAAGRALPVAGRGAAVAVAGRLLGRLGRAGFFTAMAAFGGAREAGREMGFPLMLVTAARLAGGGRVGAAEALLAAAAAADGALAPAWQVRWWWV